MFEKHLWQGDILSKDAGHRLYLKCHSFKGVFQTFCQEKPTTWFLRERNIGRKWLNWTEVSVINLTKVFLTFLNLKGVFLEKKNVYPFELLQVGKGCRMKIIESNIISLRVDYINNLPISKSKYNDL